MSDFDLNVYVPSCFEQTELNSDLKFLRLYRHLPTGAPMGLARGCGPSGQLFGAIVYFRTEDDSGNVEMECPLEQIQSTLQFVATLMNNIRPSDNVESMWSRFMATLFKELSHKTLRAGDGTPVRPESDRPETADPTTNECMICLDRPADTIVAPCMHQVVCASCSPKLQATPDAKICCQCRQSIDGVYYPNNEVEKL